MIKYVAMDAYSENPQVKIALQSGDQIMVAEARTRRPPLQRDMDHTGVSSHPERLSANMKEAGESFRGRGGLILFPERVVNVVSLREKYLLPQEGHVSRETSRNETDLRSEGGLISQGHSFVQLARFPLFLRLAALTSVT